MLLQTHVAYVDVLRNAPIAIHTPSTKMSASIQDGDFQHQNADCSDIVKSKVGAEKGRDAPSSSTSNEYPTGLKLAIIMIALNLCVFIQSLDNVSTWFQSLSKYTQKTLILCI